MPDATATAAVAARLVVGLASSAAKVISLLDAAVVIVLLLLMVLTACPLTSRSKRDCEEPDWLVLLLAPTPLLLPASSTTGLAVNRACKVGLGSFSGEPLPGGMEVDRRVVAANTDGCCCC